MPPIRRAAISFWPTPRTLTWRSASLRPASGYHFIVAEFDTSLSGYACFGPIPCTTASYDLYWIAVDAGYQRHGIGRALVSAVEARVATLGGDRIYIDTSGKELYAPTRAFYERYGYHCDARLKDFYAPGDDRVIYVKVFAGGSKPKRKRQDFRMPLQDFEFDDEVV